jgi:hypothetical protein
MIFKSCMISAGLMFAGVSMADTFNCGVWLDDSEDAAVTFAYDTATEKAHGVAGDFIGVIQKQQSGELVAVVGRKDKSLAASLYPATAERLIAMLKGADEKRATLGCEKTGFVLSRPSINLN